MALTLGAQHRSLTLRGRRCSLALPGRRCRLALRGRCCSLALRGRRYSLSLRGLHCVPDPARTVLQPWLCEDSAAASHCEDGTAASHCEDGAAASHCEDGAAASHCEDGAAASHCEDGTPASHCEDGAAALTPSRTPGSFVSSRGSNQCGVSTANYKPVRFPAAPPRLRSVIVMRRASLHTHQGEDPSRRGRSRRHHAIFPQLCFIIVRGFHIG